VSEKHDQIARIREAARLIRQRAEAATEGPWESLDGGDRLVAWKLDPSGRFDDDFDYVVDEPIANAANAEHIASWHPGVALAVAALLNSLADLYAAGIAEPQPLPMAIVRAYLGEVDHG
jgi:hypothetical protein